METVVISKSFWENKRVFLTGHTGFKGSWLSLWLQHLGAQVTGYALPVPVGPSLFNLVGIGEGMHNVLADICDLNQLSVAMAAQKPEIVIHMAAQSLVGYSYEHPVETYQTNVMGTVNVLEAVRKTEGVRVVLIVTSDKCYDNREWVWGYRENDPMGGRDPYSNSKGCAELVTAAYRNSFFSPQTFSQHHVAIASARAGNVIGGGDWAKNRLIPDCMQAILAGKPVEIRNPSAIRPWQHVLEPLGGYMTLVKQLWDEGPALAEGWNFGPGPDDVKPVQWIVEKMIELWGPEASWQLGNTSFPHEAQHLNLDISKATQQLGWRPRWNLEQGLELIVEWYRAYQKKHDVKNIMLKQIESYVSRPEPY